MRSAAAVAPPAAPPAGWLPRAGSALIVLARPGQESADLGGLLFAFRRAGTDLALPPWMTPPWPRPRTEASQRRCPG